MPFMNKALARLVQEEHPQYANDADDQVSYHSSFMNHDYTALLLYIYTTYFISDSTAIPSALFLQRECSLLIINRPFYVWYSNSKQLCQKKRVGF